MHSGLVPALFLVFPYPPSWLRATCASRVRSIKPCVYMPNLHTALPSLEQTNSTATYANPCIVLHCTAVYRPVSQDIDISRIASVREYYPNLAQVARLDENEALPFMHEVHRAKIVWIVVFKGVVGEVGGRQAPAVLLCRVVAAFAVAAISSHLPPQGRCRPRSLHTNPVRSMAGSSSCATCCGCCHVPVLHV
jgi:hypothetical protein